MKLIKTFSFLSLLIFTLSLYAQQFIRKENSKLNQDTVKWMKDTIVDRSDTTSVTRLDTLRKVYNGAFKSGEYLRFDVNYGFVTAGEAIMQITDTVYNGRDCYKIEFFVNSKPFFNWIYKVEDKYKTIVDAEGLFPWRFEQHIREGRYSRDFVAEFDQIEHIAKTSEGVYPIPPYVNDMMSAFYFTRTFDFTNYKIGEKIRLQNFYKDTTYELDVKFKGYQTLDVDAGKFKCVIVEPLVKEGGLFKSEGRVYIWMTADERKIPIKVSTKIVVGSIDAELVEYRGINGTINAKISDD